MLIVATKGRSNKETFTVKKDGSNFDLSAATKVEVVVGGEKLDSESASVSFTGSTISIEFGDLNLPSNLYSVRIAVFANGDSEGEEIVGPGKDTEMQLQYFA